MSGGLMSFGAFVWPRLPDKLELRAEKNLQRLLRPGAGEVLQDLGNGGREILGAGTFLGPQAEADFQRLSECLKAPAGLFQAPGVLPVEAVFALLRLEGPPRVERVDYSFRLVERIPEKVPLELPYVTREGDTLWLLAARYGCTVDALLEANPWVRRADSLEPGRKLVLP